MGYTLQAFIGRQSDLKIISAKYDNAQVVSVGQEISIIPMTEDLFDEINALSISEDINSFTFLTTNIEQEILKLIDNNSIGYIEADYFGGEGGQIGILWKDKRRLKLFDKTHNTINSILKYFGTTAHFGKDEFDTLNLGRHRETIDWLIT